MWLPFFHFTRHNLPPGAEDPDHVASNYTTLGLIPWPSSALLAPPFSLSQKQYDGHHYYSS